MKSLILRTSAWLMIPVLLLFSIFLLLRGHNLPGGGFVGGLVAASAVVLQLVASGPGEVRRLIPFDVSPVAACRAADRPALRRAQPAAGPALPERRLGDPAHLGTLKVGTPVLFDVGVYLVVLGITVQIILSMAEEEQWN
jgi:multicomponent Na+:H+ antiporter subunit B